DHAQRAGVGHLVLGLDAVVDQLVDGGQALPAVLGRAGDPAEPVLIPRPLPVLGGLQLDVPDVRRVCLEVGDGVLALAPAELGLFRAPGVRVEELPGLAGELSYIVRHGAPFTETVIIYVSSRTSVVAQIAAAASGARGHAVAGNRRAQPAGDDGLGLGDDPLH